MKRSTALVVVAVLLFAAGCAKRPLVSHQGPEALAVHIATYAVVTHAVGTSASADHLFGRSIHDTMSQRGYSLVHKNDADLLVSYKRLLMPVGSPESVTGGAIGGELTRPGGDVRKVVVVMLEEARTDQVLWVGWSLGEYPHHEILRRTGDSLTEILARVPPRATLPPLSPVSGGPR